MNTSIQDFPDLPSLKLVLCGSCANGLDTCPMPHYHYLKNAYRVILTRARQGMIVFVPKGAEEDATRLPAYYDQTYEFLKKCGLRDWV